MIMIGQIFLPALIIYHETENQLHEAWLHDPLYS